MQQRIGFCTTTDDVRIAYATAGHGRPLLRVGVTILDSEVVATAHADVRGALMVDTTVPVGFQSLHCDVSLTVPASCDKQTLKTLMTGAEQCCVVFQTLKGGTRVVTDWRIDEPPSE